MEDQRQKAGDRFALASS